MSTKNKLCKVKDLLSYRRKAMKKILCLALIILTLVCVFTGCNSTVTTANRPGTSARDAIPNMNDRSNVSTSRDGTVNGKRSESLPEKGMEAAKNMMPKIDKR